MNSEEKAGEARPGEAMPNDAPTGEAQPVSIYPAVNRMVAHLLKVCPDFDVAKSTAIEPGARRVMYSLGHYVIEKIQTGKSASLAPLCDTLEKILEDAVWEVRTELTVFIGCVSAHGSLNNISPEPFRAQLGEKGRQFWQETIDFNASVGPLRYEEGTY